MPLGVMKVIGIDFIVVLIFYSFNDVFVSSWVYKMFMEIDWLLSNYHNNASIHGILRKKRRQRIMLSPTDPMQ